MANLAALPRAQTLGVLGLPQRLARPSPAWGFMPSLLSWLALLMLFVGIAPWLVSAFLIADLLLASLKDGALLRHHVVLPDGYLELRTRLTAGASLALVLALTASF